MREDWAATLAELEADLVGISGRLVQAGRAAESTKMLPDAGLLDELGRLRSRFLELRQGIVGAESAQDLCLDPLSCDSLRELAQEAEQSDAQRQFEERRQTAIRKAGEAARLVHSDGAEVAGLAECKRDAVAALQRLEQAALPETTETDGLVSEWIDGHAPAAAVLGVVLNDAHWFDLLQIVKRVYGDALTDALFAHQLVVAGDEGPEGGPGGDAEITCATDSRPSPGSALQGVCRRQGEAPLTSADQPAGSVPPLRATKPPPAARKRRSRSTRSETSGPATKDEPADLIATVPLSAAADRTDSPTPEQEIEPTDPRAAERETPDSAAEQRSDTSGVADDDVAEEPDGLERLATEGVSEPAAAPEGPARNTEAGAEKAADGSVVAPQETPGAQLAEIDDWIWRLLGERRFDLALWLSRYRELRGETANHHVPAWLIEATALSSGLRRTSGEIAARLVKLFDEQSVEGIPWHDDDTRWNHAVRFLCSAASLRSALLLSHTHALIVLEALRPKGETQHTQELWTGIAEYVRRGVVVEPSVLALVERSQDLEAAKTALQADVDQWLTEQSHATLIYHAATAVWHALISEGGEIHRGFVCLRNENLDDGPDKHLMQRWMDHQAVEEMVRRTDARLRGRSSKLKPIDYRALQQLRHKVTEAAGYLQRWHDLLAASPARVQNWQVQRALELRQLVEAKAQSSIDEALGLAEEAAGYQPLEAAARCYQQALESLLESLRPDGADAPAERPAAELLGCELFRLVDVPHPLSDGADPQPEHLERVVAYLACEGWDDSEALRRQTDAGDLAAAQRLWDFLEHSLSADDLADLTERLDASKAYWDRQITGKTLKVREQLENAASYNLLDPERESSLGKRLQVAERRVSELRYDLAAVDLAALATEIAEVVNRQSETTRARLDALPMAEAWRQEILGHIARDDLVTANDLLELAEKEHLPETDPPAANGHFPQFRFDFLVPATEWLSETDPGEVVATVKNGRNAGPLRMQGVPGRQCVAAGEALGTWFTLKSGEMPTPTQVAELLRAIGFEPKNEPTLRRDRPRLLDSCTVQVAAVVDQQVCALPALGSETNGEYCVFLTRARGNIDAQALKDWGQAAEGKPVVVFCLSRVSLKQRQELFDHLRVSGQMLRVMLVDELAFTYAATRRSDRLKAVFDITSPLTWSVPYTETGGRLAPEMFYGRAQELQEILDPAGPNIVYGGRQLGKTALLREAFRRHHDPDKGRIAIFLDLNAKELGQAQDVDQLWSLLHEACVEQGILDRDQLRARDRNEFEGVVKHWLAADRSRSLLLLLDEADRLLDYDSRDAAGDLGFPRVSRLRGLMDDTLNEHRSGRSGWFKVIFAGLHNVCRTARGHNSPLGHMGAPIEVGPLYGEGGSYKAARELVLRPMAALGYRIETGAVARMLSLTNYYPNLIQIVCRELLQLARGRQTRPDEPPIEVNVGLVDQAYQASKGKIRDKLNLTLQLDPRYKLLTYTIGLLARNDPAVLSSGAALDEVDREARYWWPDGLADQPLLGVQGLLDELCGLGVLRSLGPRTYAPRNPHVINLLGGTDEIGDVLLDESWMEVPRPFERASFRRRDPEAEKASFSPLTLAQEDRILAPGGGLSLCFGSAATELDQVVRFLGLAAKNWNIGVQPVDPPTLPALQTALRRTVDGRSEAEPRHLLVLRSRVDWNSEWVEAVVACLDDLDSHRRPGILFLGDAQHAWQWAGLPETNRKQREERLRAVFSLERWQRPAIGRLLDALNQSSEGVADVLNHTGGWPELVNDWRDQPDKGTEPSALTDGARARNLLERFGLGTGACAPALPVLKCLADFAELSVSELTDFTDVEPSTVQRVIRWAELLGYVRCGRDGHFVDETIARLLSSAEQVTV